MFATMSEDLETVAILEPHVDDSKLVLVPVDFLQCLLASRSGVYRITLFAEPL
jgi:hypothetical protein